MKTHVPVACVLAAFAGCGGPSEQKPATSPPSETPLTVAVVNYPLAYFAERVGGPHVEVVFLAPAGGDPAHWSPGPEAVLAYQEADLILLNGADYAKWIAQASLPAAKMVDTGAAYADQLIEFQETVTHAHGPEGEHAHPGVAFTTWLDPDLALEQARAIAAALAEARPVHKADFAQSLALLEADLAALATRFEAVAGAIGDAPLVFSHPVYQYLERRYGLNGRSVHWEPDSEPSEKEWHDLGDLLGQHPARWMIWEGEPLASVVTRLEELGLTSVVFDPCGNRPDEGDFLSAMDANLGRLEGAWSPGE